MTPYEAAVNMFHREHARWNQWVLFYFGSIVSIFVISEKTILYIPKWFPSLLGFVVSIMFIAVATTLRASTTAWRETILELEESDQHVKGEEKVFHIQEEKWKKFNHLKDLKTTLFFRQKKTFTSVTRLLTLFGVLSAFCFLLLFILNISSCNHLPTPIS